MEHRVTSSDEDEAPRHGQTIELPLDRSLDLNKPVSCSVLKFLLTRTLAQVPRATLPCQRQLIDSSSG